MNAVRVIPCLDVDAGRVVKGVNFVGLRDAGDPVELAARYDAEGADELVFLDITASSDARDTIVDVVARTAEEVFIPFTVGGGIRTVEDARRLLRAGADKVSVNTAAVERPELVARDRRGVRGAVRRASPSTPAGTRRHGLGGLHPRRAHAGRASTRWRGPQRPSALGAGEILLTSMDRDGTRDGLRPRAHPGRGATPSACRSSPAAAWARSTTWSRGSVEGGADAVLAASIFHFGEHTVGRGQGAPGRRRRHGASGWGHEPVPGGARPTSGGSPPPA